MEKHRPAAQTPPETAQKPGRRQKRTKKKKHRAPLVLLVLLLALGAAGLWAASRVRPPEQPPAPAAPADTEPPEEDEGDAPAAAAGVRDGVYTILLIGQRDGNTDTMMVALLDTEKGEMNVVSIPRDTVVDVERRVPKINGAYNSAGGGTAGVEQLREELSTILGYRPASYACVNMQGFIDLVDAIGGVEFDVPVRMYKKWENIDLQPGLQTLTGTQALGLVRFRGYTTGMQEEVGIAHDDYGRMQMQQRFLKALAEQTLTHGNIGKIPEFLRIADENLTTDLDAGNIAWFARQVLAFGTDGLHFSTLPTVSVEYDGPDAAHGYYENLLPDEALALINERLNPFDTPITAEMVDHRILG